MGHVTGRIVGAVLLGGLLPWLNGCGGCGASRTPATGSAAVVLPEPNVPNPICEDDLLDICFLPGGQTGFVVGAHRTLLGTRDGSRTWRRLLPRDERGDDFLALTFVNTTNGWALSREHLLQTLDGGATWTDMPRPAGNFYHFGAMSAGPAGLHLIQPPTCGASVYLWRPGATQWETLPGTLPRNDYETLFFLDEQHGWAGAGHGFGARTADGGRTWTPCAFPQGRVAHLSFHTPADGVARLYSDHAGGIQVTHDGGVSWQLMPAGIPPLLNVMDLQFLDAQNGFLLYEEGMDGCRLLRTQDGGAIWSEMLAPRVRLNALHFTDTRSGWAVGPKGMLCRIERPPGATHDPHPE